MDLECSNGLCQLNRYFDCRGGVVFLIGSHVSSVRITVTIPYLSDIPILMFYKSNKNKYLNLLTLLNRNC